MRFYLTTKIHNTSQDTSLAMGNKLQLNVDNNWHGRTDCTGRIFRRWALLRTDRTFASVEAR